MKNTVIGLANNEYMSQLINTNITSSPVCTKANNATEFLEKIMQRHCMENRVSEDEVYS